MTQRKRKVYFSAAIYFAHRVDIQQATFKLQESGGASRLAIDAVLKIFAE